MRYKHRINFPPDYEFSIEELSAITPEDIYKWFSYKLYGIEMPGPSDNPIFGKSNSMLSWKKHISFFIPDNLIQWSVQSRSGNPTQSRIINDLINVVKKKETRGLGRPSQADRPFEKEEFHQVLSILQAGNSFDWQYRYPAMLKFMFHLIARGDDAAHVKKENLVASTQYPWALTVKLRWSKNVNDPRDCPHQILLGAMDVRYCVLLSMVLFLEYWIESGAGMTSPWLFGEGVTNDQSTIDEMDKEADRTKRGLYEALQHVFANPNFVLSIITAIILGVHSTKKYGTTHARRRGTPKDFVDYRARWKASKRIQDGYADVVLPWPDIKTASTLCIGGICKYNLKQGCGLSDEWLIEHVTPAIRERFGDGVAAILAKPLLWACQDAECASMVPGSIRTRVLNALVNVAQQSSLSSGENCVEKVLTVANEADGEVFFDEVRDVAGGTGGTGRSAAGNTDGEWKNAMYAKVSSVEHTVVGNQNSMASHHAQYNKRLDRMDANIKRIAVMPGARIRSTMGGASGIRARASANLMNCPKDLYILWAEYEVGVGGNKPARQFTAAERGKVKFKYSRRKNVWDVIDIMISAGNTSDVAIERIYTVYGQQPVNKIIDELRQAKKAGGHPMLR